MVLESFLWVLYFFLFLCIWTWFELYTHSQGTLGVSVSARIEVGSSRTMRPNISCLMLCWLFGNPQRHGYTPIQDNEIIPIPTKIYWAYISSHACYPSILRCQTSTHAATVTILNMEYDMSSIIGHTYIQLSHLRTDFCCYPGSCLYLHANFVLAHLKFWKGEPLFRFLKGALFRGYPLMQENNFVTLEKKSKKIRLPKN